MFDKYMRPAGYCMVVIGTLSVLISALQLYMGHDSLFAMAKAAVFVLIGVWVLRSSVKP